MSALPVTTTSATETIMFTRGVPATEAFPTEQLAECFSASLHADAGVVLQYGHQAGYPRLRHLLAQEYTVDDNNVFVTSGSLLLQDLLSAHLIKPGTSVLVEQPSYDRAITTFRRHGAHVIGVPLQDDGLDIERLEGAVRRQIPAFLYVIPDFQNPAGVTTSLAKRRAIIDLADRYGFLVIEDVPYHKLRYRGEDLPLLREIDATRIITMSSLSKLLSPGLRIGYLVGSAALISALTKLAEEVYLSPVLPVQAAVTEYIQRGWLPPHIERLKQLYRPRWEAALQAMETYLPGIQASKPDGGFFVSVMLPEHVDTTSLLERAKLAGLILTPGKPFFADPDLGGAPNGARFIRLPFCALTPEQVTEGIRRLANLI